MQTNQHFPSDWIYNLADYRQIFALQETSKFISKNTGLSWQNIKRQR